jgi:hypothetical protein
MPYSGTKEEKNKKWRDWYHSNPKNSVKAYDNVKTRRKYLVSVIEEYKKTLTCTCGENRPVCIDFHHNDETKKEFDISTMVQRGTSVKRLMEEIKKCTPMCANCHRVWHQEHNKAAEV